MSRSDVDRLRQAYMTHEAGSGEHAAVAVLLGYAPLVDQQDFHRHVSSDGITWDALLKENWSETDRLLIQAAYALWRSGGVEIDLGRAMAFLDDQQFAVWRDMLTARRTGRVPDQAGAAGPYETRAEAQDGPVVRGDRSR